MVSRIETVSDQVVVFLSGSIDVDVATSLKEKLFPFVENGSKYFIIHMNDVLYIDSSGIGVLVAIQKKVGQFNGIVSLYGMKDEVKQTFESAKLSRIFEIK